MRIRTIKPEFFSSERIALLSDAAKVTLMGLLCEADDYGVARAHPGLLKGHIWPLADHVTAATVAAHLEEFLEARPRPLIRLFDAEGLTWIHVTGFGEHQTVNRPSKRRNPSPPPVSVSPPGALPEPSPMEMEMEVEMEGEMEVEPVVTHSGPTHQEPTERDGYPQGGPSAGAAVLEMPRQRPARRRRSTPCPDCGARHAPANPCPLADPNQEPHPA